MKQLMILVIAMAVTLGSYTTTLAANSDFLGGVVVMVVGEKIAVTFDTEGCNAKEKHLLVLDEAGNTAYTHTFFGDKITLSNHTLKAGKNYTAVVSIGECVKTAKFTW